MTALIYRLANTYMADQTLGETRVRASFNPTANENVDSIKTQSAALIDLCENLKTSLATEGEEVPKETVRLLALAQTSFEEAAMWAVKAATASAPAASNDSSESSESGSADK